MTICGVTTPQRKLFSIKNHIDNKILKTVTQLTAPHPADILAATDPANAAAFACAKRYPPGRICRQGTPNGALDARSDEIGLQRRKAIKIHRRIAGRIGSGGKNTDLIADF